MSGRVGLAGQCDQQVGEVLGAPRTEAESGAPVLCPVDDLGDVTPAGRLITRLAQQSVRAKTRYTALSAECQSSSGNGYLSIENPQFVYSSWG